MKPVGIYIHVPFCRYKCPYCDFYSVTAKDELLDRFAEETIRRIGELSGEKISADTVYFGGGTPSLLGGGTSILRTTRKSPSRQTPLLTSAHFWRDALLPESTVCRSACSRQ